MKKEYSFYSNELSHLQGKHVPRCYGIFRGKLYGRRVYCLLLEYVGLPERAGLLNMTMDERYAAVSVHPQGAMFTVHLNCRLDLIDALMLIHRAGIRHNDIRGPNVCFLADSGPYIIDFEHAQRHTCRRALNVQEGAIAPDQYDFQCDEIWELANDLEIWRPGMSCLFSGMSIYGR